MVLIVIPHIKCECIHRTIITIRLLFFIKGKIMFLNPTGSKGVKTHRKKEADQQEEKCFGAKQHPCRDIECNLHNPVCYYPTVHRLDLFETKSTDGLKNREEQEPQGFTKKRIIDQFGFP